MDECFTEMEHHLAAEQEKVKDTRSQAIYLGIWRFRMSGEVRENELLRFDKHATMAAIVVC